MQTVEQLQDRVAELEYAMGLTAQFPDAVIPREIFPTTFNGLPKCCEFLSIVLARPFASKEAMYIAMYGARPESDQPAPKVLDVFACRVRRALKAHGIELRTSWGGKSNPGGYYLTTQDKDRLRAKISEIKLRKAAA